MGYKKFDYLIVGAGFAGSVMAERLASQLDKKVFDYLSQFTEWIPYEHKVLAKLDDKLYPIPINRITLNRLYDLNLQTEKEVEDFYQKVREKRYPIKNSEDIIVNQVGTDLFEKFFRHYTKKQWDLEIEILVQGMVQGKCIKLPVQIVVTKQKFLSNQKKADLFIAEIATRNIEGFNHSKFSD